MLVALSNRSTDHGLRAQAHVVLITSYVINFFIVVRPAS